MAKSARRMKTKVPQELRYFYLNGKLYHLLQVKRYPNLCTAWDYSNKERVVFQWSEVQREAQKAYSVGQVAGMIGVSRMTLYRWEREGLIRKPLLAKGIGDTIDKDTFGEATKWRWYSPDDIMAIYDAIMDRYDGEPHPQLENLVLKTELISRLNDSPVLYFKNESGEFSPVWKAPDW
jgi:hypothetical protein